MKSRSIGYKVRDGKVFQELTREYFLRSERYVTYGEVSNKDSLFKREKPIEHVYVLRNGGAFVKDRRCYIPVEVRSVVGHFGGENMRQD